MLAQHYHRSAGTLEAGTQAQHQKGTLRSPKSSTFCACLVTVVQWLSVVLVFNVKHSVQTAMFRDYKVSSLDSQYQSLTSGLKDTGGKKNESAIYQDIIHSKENLKIAHTAVKHCHIVLLTGIFEHLRMFALFFIRVKQRVVFIKHTHLFQCYDFPSLVQPNCGQIVTHSDGINPGFAQQGKGAEITVRTGIRLFIVQSPRRQSWPDMVMDEAICCHSLKYQCKLRKLLTHIC